MVSVTQFPDQFREEVYWLSESGQLLAVLPVVGKGPHGNNIKSQTLSICHTHKYWNLMAWEA